MGRECRVLPKTSDGEFCGNLPEKERQGKMEQKKKEIRKREGGKLKMEGGKVTK